MSATRASLLGWLRSAPVSLVLVGLQVLAAVVVSWRLGPLDDPTAQVAAGALERSRVWAGQPWRLVSAELLHAGWLHLAANVGFGLGWYRLVERAVGPVRFLALWLLAAVGASAASLLAQDVVSVGASGALLGTVGATLALHRRTLPGWRAFFRSPGVIQVAVSLAAFTGVTLAARFPVDHAAHAGGLVTGAAAAWIATRPPPRGAAWGAFAVALLALSLAASWPRPGLTAWETRAVRAALEALGREDPEAAAAAARPLEQGGWRTTPAREVRARLLEARGAHDEAEAVLRQLLAAGDAGADASTRRVARRLLFRIGYRFYTGDGAPADPARGYSLIRDACAAGDEAACRAEAEIRTGVPAARAP